MELLADNKNEQKALTNNCHYMLLFNGWTRKFKPTIAQCENCIHYQINSATNVVPLLENGGINK